jgi:hypothetical protein
MDKTGLYNFNNRVTISLFFTVMFLVFLNIFTPLRLITDGIRYLNILEYLNGGLDKTSYLAHDVLPHGYPWLLLLIDKLNLLGPMSITIINILCTLFSCYILTKILTIDNKYLFFSLVMLSFINIKHFTLPVSDQLFVMLFITSIYLWSKFFAGRKYYIIPALLLTVACVFVRTAGIALIPGIVFYMIYSNRAKFMASKRLVVIISLMLFLVIVIFIIKLSVLETKIDYLRQLNLMTMIGHPFSIIDRLLLHFKEIGELTLNIPYSKLTGIIKINSFDTAQYLFVVLGVIALWVFFKAIFRFKLFDHFAFWVFLTYLIMIFLWPFYDTRFLIPVIPLFLYLFFSYLFKFIESSYVKIIPLFIYVLLGFISLIYSDAISLNKSFFLNHYGFDQQLTNKYRVHFRNKNNTGSKPAYSITDENVSFLLEKYDR